ncbi:MAG: hypothetical protein J7L99_05960 [Planctomycetes bacterium]|nr:hypothetical protein [Planctomycetota bacterium]
MSRITGVSLLILILCFVAAVEATENTTPPGLSQPSRKAATSTSAPAVRIEAGRVITSEGWFRLPHVKRPPLPSKVTRGFIIPIHGPITQTTYEAVKRKVMQCKARGAQLVIFDMNTPGGQADAMDNIVRLIIDDLRDIYTVAYVNPEAVSAGAIISLACNEIVMSPTGVIGDAMPIMVVGGQVQEIPEKIRGKIESYIRAKVRMLAERNGHNKALCEAMVTISMEIWLIRNKKSGELKIVNAKDFSSATRPARGKIILPDEDWEYVRTIDEPTELVTLHAQEARRLAFIKHIFPDINSLEKHYHIVVEPVVLGDTWSERLVAILTTPLVMSILLLVGILAAYVELNTPGFGVPGTIAVICFAIIFGSRYLTGLAQWWEIAIFFIGVLLLFVEIFITPGFGLMGVMGILFCIVGLLAMLVPNAPTKFPLPTTKIDLEIFSNGLLALLIAFIGSAIGGVVLSRVLPRVPVAGKLVLPRPEVQAAVPASERSPILKIKPGQVGTVRQTCRPVGKVEIDGQLVDAVADGAFLEKGTKIVVLRNEGNRIVVDAKNRQEDK